MGGARSSALLFLFLLLCLQPIGPADDPAAGAFGGSDHSFDDQRGTGVLEEIGRAPDAAARQVALVAPLVRGNPQ